MSLITLAEYKSLTGTTTNTNDAFISSLIPAIQSTIETHCDRKFDRAINGEWLCYSENLILDQWPVNNVLMIGTTITVGTITDTTNTYTFSIVAGKNAQDGIGGMYMTNQYSLATTFYSFVTYTTLGALKMALELIAGVTLAYPTDPTYSYNLMSTALLRDCNGTTLMGAYNQPQLQYRITEGTRRCLSVPQNLNTMFVGMDWWYESTIYVRYDYGYSTENVPQDLKQIASNIIKDTISISNVAGGGIYSSITVTNFSETLWDYSQINKLVVDKYAPLLEPYRRKLC
jgi:hypothetical protein